MLDPRRKSAARDLYGWAARAAMSDNEEMTRTRSAANGCRTTVAHGRVTLSTPLRGAPARGPTLGLSATSETLHPSTAPRFLMLMFTPNAEPTRRAAASKAPT
jgi:hypothetical protein